MWRMKENYRNSEARTSVCQTLMCSVNWEKRLYIHMVNISLCTLIVAVTSCINEKNLDVYNSRLVAKGRLNFSRKDSNPEFLIFNMSCLDT